MTDTQTRPPRDDEPRPMFRSPWKEAAARVAALCLAIHQRNARRERDAAQADLLEAALALKWLGPDCDCHSCDALQAKLDRLVEAAERAERAGVVLHESG